MDAAGGADDKGGFQPYVDPPEVFAARAVLDGDEPPQMSMSMFANRKDYEAAKAAAEPMPEDVAVQWAFIRDTLNEPGNYRSRINRFVEWMKKRHG